MSRFTTRVVLHDASREDYESLHDYMAEVGFGRTISSTDEVYHLPDAEYNYEAGETKEAVLDRAKGAATRTSRKFAILVTESAGRCWHSLERA